MKNTTLTVAAFNPFTGGDAAFGPEMMAGCLAAANSVNAAGGVLSNKVACSAVDTRGDPADAVTAAAKMLATTSHLFGVLGPSSDEADATAPLINAAKITMFADTGEASFDHTKLQYFWRMTPADDVLGYAMALYAKQKGYLRGAAIFGNDIGSQGIVPTLTKGYNAVGGQMVLNEKIAQGQSSYQPEVEQIIAAKPQVIFTETSPQAASTILEELQQLGHLIPVVGSDATVEAAWLQAVSGAIGKPALSKYFVGTIPYAPASGPAWTVYNKYVLSTPGVVKPASQWSTDSYSMVDYDGVIVMALAAAAAKSTSPAVYNKYIEAVTTASSTAVTVNSYAEGLAALKAGKKIDYVGATGIIAWDQYHNSTGGFEITGYQPNGNTPLVTTITADQIAPLTK
ncbi:MAG: ABC transporter substrate-binding protein [Streptosporangiaceae bacterium]